MKKLYFICTSFMLLFVATTTFAQEKTLSKEEAANIKVSILKDWKENQIALLKKNTETSCIEQNDLTMKYSTKIFGDEPTDGRSMWISMHGGGNAPTSLNNSQWENQKVLYQPAEGIYVCPRAPWDDWDMWFKNPIDSMFEELIRTLVVYNNVNPNKVYIMGYSAGGDGVWRMGPRMADHWAAASMMAGHPGDVNLLSIRNLPFMIWCGGNDTAYDRNKLDAQRGLQLDSLQSTDPEGFIHSTHIVAGKPHWMDLEDKAALPWMAKYQRNPYPKTVLWCQGDNGRPYFYWLGVPRNETKKGNIIRAYIKGNVITIGQCDYTKVTIYLNDALVNLDKAIKVVHNGKTLFKGKLPRTEENLRSSMEERNDPSYCFPSNVTIKL